MKVLGIIPSRYQSTRFPGKPLAIINGKAMIQRVYEQAAKASSLSKVVVATDDQRIFDFMKSFGGNVVMTSVHHQNGTERCAEALRVEKEAFDAVINIQGDEPFIQPEQIDLAASCLKDDNAEIATLVKRIEKAVDYQNPSIVKVEVTENLEATNFGRSLKENIFFKHIGIYGFKALILLEIVGLSPSNREQAESLEQLRWLDNGYQIKVRETHLETQAIDTPEDIAKLQLL